MAEAVTWLQKLNELPEAERTREIKSKLPSVVFTPLENAKSQNAIKYLQFLQKWIPNSPDMLYHDDSNSIVGFYLLKLISFIATAAVNSEVYRVGIDVMQLLINLIFTRDLTVFRSFFKDAVLLLKDLEDVHAYLKTTSDGQVGIKIKCFATFAPHFKTPENVEQPVSEVDLDVSSVEKVMNVQGCIVNIYGRFIEKSHQFLPDISCNIWECLFLYIQRHQSSDMLAETLHTVDLMLTYCGAPAPILDELAKVLCQLLTISEDRSDETDVKLSQCILKVLPLLRADAIQPLSLGFMEILQYTLQYSKCHPLKESLCTVLNVWIPKYPSLVEKLSDVLLPFIDDLVLSKIMIECLITAIKHETRTTQTDIEQKPPKRRKLDFNEYESSYSSIAGSAVLTRLLSLLDNCTFEFTRAPSMFILKTAVTVDVISRVFIEFREIYQFDTISRKYGDFLEHLEMRLCEKRSHDHTIMTAVNIAVASIRGLLFTLDAQDLSTLFEQIIRILTFPWSDAMSITSKALPKKYTIHDNVAPTEQCIHSSKDPIVVSILDKALCALNWLPPRLITSQRKRILTACLRDERTTVKCCAIRALSLFLQRNGADHLNDFIPVIMSFIDTEDVQLQQHLAFFIGHWVCLYTQRPTVKNSTTKDFKFEYLKDNNTWRVAPGSSEYSLTFLNHCQTCALHKRFPSEYKPIVGSINVDEYDMANRVDVVNTVDQVTFRRLKDLFVYMEVKRASEVRVAFLSSLQRILRHVSINNEDLFKLLETILGFSKETDPAIRAAIPEAIVPFVLLDNAPVLEKLFIEISNALETSSERQSVLAVIGLVGSFVTEDPLLFCLIKLVDNLTHNEPSIKATAYDQIRLIADKKKVTLGSLLTSCKHKLYPRIVQRLLGAPEVVMEFSSALLDLEYRDFLRDNMKIYLPHLIAEETLDHTNTDIEQKKALIMDISSRVDIQPKEMLMKYLPYVLTHCLIHPRAKQAINVCSDILTQMTDLKLPGLFSKCRYQLVTKLLLKMTKPEPIKQRAYKALNATCQQANDSQCSLATFLKDCFLAIMNIFSKKLSSKTSMEKKLQTLKAVRELIGLLGDHLDTFHLKIGNTIMLAEKYPPLVPEALDTWLTLAQKMKVETLGSVLSQMVVHLLGFVTEHQVKVTYILNYFFFDVPRLGPYFSEIPFMPDNIPALEKIAAMYETLAGTSEANLQETISRLIRVFKHDSANVRELALDQITKILREKRKEMEDIMFDEKMNSFVKTFVEALLEGCRDPSKNVRLKVGMVLGELGAIDPSRVPIVVASEYGTSLDKENPGLAIELIKDYLVKCYRTDRPGNSQDRAAFAIQEILKYFGCSEESIDGRTTATPEKGGNFWIKLPADVQLIIRPFLSSHYYELQKNSAVPDGVIYKPFLAYRKWVTEWVIMLIDRTKHTMFLACKGVVKVDLDTAHFLLPHLVLHCLTQGSAQDYKQIRDEIMAVISNSTEMSPHKNAGGVGGIRTFNGVTNFAQQPASEISQEATQRVFSLLDSLNRHVELKKRALTEKTKSPSKPIRGSPSTALKRVEELLNDIPQALLAHAALRVKAYARALLYYETHIRKVMKEKNKREFKDFIANDLAFLQKVYSGLDETDAVGGLSNLRSAASLSEQITELEAQGRWHEALLYYDQAMIEKEDDIGLFTGRLKCLQNLGRVEEVLELSRAALYDTKRFSKASAGIIRLHGIRAAWRLSNWNALDNLLPGVVDPDFEVFLAKALVAMKKNDEKEFQEMVLKARNELIGPLSAASLDSYERAYPFIIKEHMLAELEQCWNLAKNGQVTELPSIWEPRLKISQHSFKPHEQILHLRIVLSGMYLPIDVGQNWLRLAKTARIAYQYDAAEHALLKASACRPRPDFYSVENAKLLLQQGKESLAIITLKREIENKPLVDIRSEGPSLSDFVTDEIGSNGKKKNKVFAPADLCFAKNLVMLATFYHKTGQYSHDLILQRFNTASSVVDKWEKGFFALAQYYDHLIAEMRKEASNVKGDGKVLERYAIDLVPSACTNYGLAIRSGHTYIYQSLARLTTLWFDSYTPKLQPQSVPKQRVDQVIIGLERVIQCLANAKVIPAYWLIMYSQLMSRVCTPAKQVWIYLRTIIVRVLLKFPHQASWHLAYLYKSPLKARLDKFNEIKAEALKRQKELEREGRRPLHDVEEILSENGALATNLLDLCNYSAGPSRQAQTYYMSKQFPKLAKYTQSHQIIPNQAQMTVTVPSHTRIPEDDYNPFPDRMVTIKGFTEEIEVLRSLQKPKKIKIIGSDGNRYTFLCKPDDDLRKDSRMMEFHTVINKLLKKNPDARKRQLHIRTYFVTPLNDKCGLIEWVPNTNGFRNIIYTMLQSEGIYRDGKQVEKVRAIYNKHSNTNKEKDGPSLMVFVNEILPLFPPVFYRWFLQTFPEPSTFFRARLAYARSLAVMSMVGYIVGLGDRHGENILLDSSSGDVVHVDFNCLFYKGLTFDKPEKVPFRLTPQMVDALGPLGYEGTFRQVCEVTMRQLRDNKDTLLSVLETFVYDPSFEGKNRALANRDMNGEETAEGLNILKGVADRLEGKKRTPNNKHEFLMPLSVEGQVQSLIDEAVSFENLHQMYIGWASYL